MNFKPFSLLESIKYNLDTDKQATKTHAPGTVDDPKIRRRFWATPVNRK